MVTHFPDDREVRAAVDPVLRAWKASAFLERYPIAFRFRDEEVIDRNPPKVDIALTHSNYATVKVRAMLSAERTFTRSPPGERRVSPLSKL